MQIPSIIIILQHFRYKSLDNVCLFFTVCEENDCFSLSRLDLLYSLPGISFRCNARKSLIVVFAGEQN